VKKTSNGAAKAAITTTTKSMLPVVQRKRGEDALDFDLRQRSIRRDANRERYGKPSIPVTIMLSPVDYGLLAGGAVHHQTTVEDLVAMLVNANICEATGDGFFFYLEE
jgi:hypothetical protein